MMAGEVERAEVNFKAVYSSATATKKEYLFGALVGLVRLLITTIIANPDYCCL